MERINTKKFASVFRDIHKSSTDRRFCFILGAGASKASGIPTGFDLAKNWFEEIKEIEKIVDFENWFKDNKIDEKQLGNFYGIIYKKRFSIDEQSGYDILNKVMENARPSFGYSVLAQLLSNSQHNIVITTNFDSLMEEALFTFSYKRPLVCGHESLTGYAKASLTRPLIAKIHRDLLLHPMNSPGDIKKLANGWAKALDGVFNTSIPIVIGYGGNDGSLMGYLKSKKGLENFFWCVRKGEEPKKEVVEILDNNKGKLVEIEDFDSLMFDLLEALDLKLLDKELEDTAKKRAESYRESVKKIKEAKENSPDKEDRDAAEKLHEKTKPNSAWSFILRAESVKDRMQKIAILNNGLEKFPTNVTLLNELGWQYYLSKNIKAEEIFKKALMLDPNNEVANGCYAVFLSEIKRDYEEAEKYYIKSLEISPNDAILHGNYANYLKQIKLNYDEAEKHYLKAIELDPEDASINCNYANFLFGIRKEYFDAEKFYKKSLEKSPNDEVIIGNYAGLLLGLGKSKEGQLLLSKAFEKKPAKDLELELWFYLYAHNAASRKQAEENVNRLLKEGVRSEGWDFSLNVETAIKNSHPDPKKLKNYAKKISARLK